MRKQMKFFLLGIIIILLSTPFGYTAIKIVYHNKNLTGEFDAILNGFIHSFMLIGTLIFSVGLIDVLANKKKEL